MKITSLECWAVHLPMHEPYTIAYESVEAATNVFVKMNTDKGYTGWGCAAPDMGVTGESEESVMEAFRSVIEPVLHGQDPFHYARLLEVLQAKLKNQPSALAMADMGLYDLVAKKAHEPVYKLLGGYRSHIPTSITIGILPVEQTLEKAREYIDKGFFILKIKGGQQVEEDIERVVKVREQLGDQIEIRFDANQGYSVSESVQFINRTKAARIELLEQPTDRNNTDLLKEVTDQVGVPVMADESLMTLKDVFHLTSNGCTDMINIKLMKVGGIAEALRINAVAMAAHVETMIGCMDESAMGIAAGLHLALARPNIAYADLDGHFDLQDDPFAGMVICKKGILYPSRLPGFGWSN